MDRVSYSLGINIGESLKNQGFEIKSFENFMEAIKDVYAGNKPKIDATEANAILNEEYQKIVSKNADINLEAEKNYFDENAKREEITTTTSGLQYEVLTEGNGEIPKLTDTVTTHYHGILPDGTVFDSSVQRGEPASFPVNGVIAGWVEALQIMKTGSKWRLYVPSNLAYGSRGAGGVIGPNQALIFDIELIAINK